jgi:hypothetical protein
VTGGTSPAAEYRVRRAVVLRYALIARSGRSVVCRSVVEADPFVNGGRPPVVFRDRVSVAAAAGVLGSLGERVGWFRCWATSRVHFHLCPAELVNACPVCHSPAGALCQEFGQGFGDISEGRAPHPGRPTDGVPVNGAAGKSSTG